MILHLAILSLNVGVSFFHLSIPHIPFLWYRGTSAFCTKVKLCPDYGLVALWKTITKWPDDVREKNLKKGIADLVPGAQWPQIEHGTAPV
jgi:hypothetical protein